MLHGLVLGRLARADLGKTGQWASAQECMIGFSNLSAAEWFFSQNSELGDGVGVSLSVTYHFSSKIDLII